MSTFEWTTPQWERVSVLIPVLYLDPPPPALYIFILLAPFLVRSTGNLTSDRADGFYFPSPFHMNHYHLLPTPVSSLPCLPFLPQTAPVSVGECCMNQQIPCTSLPLSPAHTVSFPSLVIRGHVSLWILLVLQAPHLSSNTSKTDNLN